MLTVRNDPTKGRVAEVAGVDRRVLALLTYPEQPAPGTIVGPNPFGELCVVLGATDDGRTAIGLATKPDIEGAENSIADNGPLSLTEAYGQRTGRLGS